MDIYHAVPDEIWEKTLTHLTGDRETLQAVIDANCPAFPQALRLYWQNEACEKELLEELEDQPESHQQSLADMVRHVVTDFKAPYAHHEARSLQFPRLQSRTVEHGKAQLRGEIHTFARVRRFVGPRLRQLEVGNSLLEGREHLIPTVDNFLSGLSVCTDLLLKLHARVKKASSVDLVHVLQCCIKLRALHLNARRRSDQ